MMSVYFNLATALWWLIDPLAWFNDYPKEVQEASTVKPEKKIGPAILFWFLVIIPVLLFSVLSAWDVDISGFWHLFWTAYVEWMFVNLGDLLGLDLLFREKLGTRLQLPGTEGMDAYKRGNWLKMGLLEHLVEWPLIVCPLFAIISAGAGLLIRMI